MWSERMKTHKMTDKEKLERIINATGISRSNIARKLEVTYKTVYRWLELGINPHPAQSNDINQIFKEYVDLRDSVMEMRKRMHLLSSFDN